MFVINVFLGCAILCPTPTLLIMPSIFSKGCLELFSHPRCKI